MEYAVKKHPTTGRDLHQTGPIEPSVLRVRIPTRVLRSVRMYAAISGQSVDQFVAEALDELLDASRDP